MTRQETTQELTLRSHIKELEVHSLRPFLVVLLLLAAACGGGDESSQADGEADPEETGEYTGSSDPAGGGSICELLTEEEVHQLLGDTVVDRRGADIEEGGNCHYTGESGASTTVHLYHDTESFDTESAFDGFLDLAGELDLDGGGTDPTMIDGLGDKAFVDRNEVHVLAGDTYFTFAAATENAAILESVARAMLPRL